MLLPFANAPGASGGSGTVTSVSVATANGFSGTVANATTTPAITIIAGAITPTSVNGLTITASTGTLTITNLKTLTIDNSLEFAGTDNTKMTFPGASDTIAGLGTIQTFTAAQTFNSGKLILAGSGSGSTTLNASAAASGTLTLPAATDTLVGKATTDTLTNKDLTSGTNTFPTFNQNTTGSAAKLTTARSIYGNNFDGTADLGQIIASTYGGTGNGFTKFSGPTTSEKTFTLPNSSDTLMGLGTADSITGVKTFGAGTAVIAGAGAGKATLAYGNTASNSTLTLPTATDTLVGKATTDTFTNKTLDTAGTGNVLKINGTQVSDKTGTGKVVLDTSPTLVTPTLGVATITSVNKMAVTAPTTAATLAFGTDNATITFQGTDTYVGRATTDTLTNKTIVGWNNTVSGIGQIPFDYFESGCVWTADAAGSTKAASMTSGVVWINGKRLTVATVTSRTFTASKDVYVDFTDNGDGTAVPTYIDNTTNAASPALTSGGVRNAIVVVGASSIAAASSINQGQENMVLPIASSIPYAVTDSLGNLICPRDPNRRTLGYRQILTDFTTTNLAQVTGLTCPVIVPTGRKIKVTVFAASVFASGVTTMNVEIWDGVVSSGTQIGQTNETAGAANNQKSALTIAMVTPTSNSKTYNAGFTGGGTSSTFRGTSSGPAYIKVELA